MSACPIGHPPLCMSSFHRQVWYRTLSLCYVCTRHSSIILSPNATLVPNIVTLASSVVELAHGERLSTQSITHSVTHPAYLIPRESKLLLRKTIHNNSYVDWFIWSSPDSVKLPHYSLIYPIFPSLLVNLRHFPDLLELPDFFESSRFFDTACRHAKLHAHRQQHRLTQVTSFNAFSWISLTFSTKNGDTASVDICHKVRTTSKKSRHV